jgi:hypothetical protein
MKRQAVKGDFVFVSLFRSKIVAIQADGRILDRDRSGQGKCSSKVSSDYTLSPMKPRFMGVMSLSRKT